MKSKIMQWLQIDDLIDKGQRYVDAKVALVKLEINQVISNLVATLVLLFILLFFAFMTLAFISIAVGAILNTIFESQFIGYLLMGFIFLILIFIVFIFMNKIRARVQLFCLKLLSESLLENISETNLKKEKENESN